MFVVDFEMNKPIAWRVEELSDSQILYDLNGKSNSSKVFQKSASSLRKFPITLNEYKEKFDVVYDALSYGDSFLTNLTIKTRVEIDDSLEELFHIGKAKFKLWMKNQFLVFSPETFIQIRNQKIFSFPMKGTIDAGIENAKEKILSDQKELTEHVTIVDLIRNDLSQVSDNVNVSRFRYIEEINTSHKRLLQVSSEIVGDLPSNYHEQLGDIIISLLPAGSISGAPKAKTIEVIQKAEKEERGYYTGIVGYFDGENLDSGVMIRFIEQKGDQYFYRSGGGITTQSDLKSEYQEAIDKVYVPID